jgi:hypothetical protein
MSGQAITRGRASTEASGRVSSCPRCKDENVHRSRRRGPIEYLISLVGFRIRRCHACNLRFATLGDSTLLTADVRKSMRKVYLFAFMAAALVTVLGLVLWFSAKQSGYASEQTGDLIAPVTRTEASA